MRGRRPRSVASSPVLVGAVTVLAVGVAVLVSYNASRGLPFVPTFELNVEAPDAARLVVGNEVREGGFRIGQVAAIEPLAANPRGARLTLRIDTAATPLPTDTTVRIRPRSALGLKYVDLLRGESDRALPDGATIETAANPVGPELDDFFSIFDARTRANVEANLDHYGTALAGRGRALNRTLGALPGLLGDLPPVMRTLADPDTRLVRMIDESADIARVLAPRAGALARGFSGMADTFEALSRDPQALRDTIARSPATLAEGIRSLPQTRPLLARLAAISDELRGGARELRASLPAVNDALRAGIPALRALPPFTDDLEGALRALRALAESPTTDLTLAGLRDTVGTANPTLRWVGPFQTVCNYFTLWWTHLADHISDEDATGTVQRVQVKNAPPEQEHPLTSFGQPLPANSDHVDPLQHELFGDAVALHAQDFGAAVTESGEADCEHGQRGYPERLATGFAANLRIAVDPRTPGAQGPTFTGRPRVPAGQTFSSEPTGISPRVVP